MASIELRAAAQQALEALELAKLNGKAGLYPAEVEEITDAITDLRAALAEPETCTWQQDGDSDSSVYGTSCRRYFNLEDGTPEDNKMKWCCYCGKKLAQALITEDSDE